MREKTQVLNFAVLQATRECSTSSSPASSFSVALQIATFESVLHFTKQLRAFYYSRGVLISFWLLNLHFHLIFIFHLLHNNSGSMKHETSHKKCIQYRVHQPNFLLLFLCGTREEEEQNVLPECAFLLWLEVFYSSFSCFFTGEAFVGNYTDTLSHTLLVSR